MAANSGIYAITNTANGRVYVGQSVNIGNRLLYHINKLRQGRHDNQHLQHAFNKYGQAFFVHSVLEACLTEQLTSREQFWMDHFRHTGLYNMHPAAGSSLGYKASAETRAKMSLIYSGRVMSEEQKKKISLANKGRRRPWTAEWREKCNAALRKLHGVPKSLGMRRKLSIAKTGTRMPQLSSAHKDAIRRANTGKIIPSETRAKISATLRARGDMSAWWRGRQQSPEHIAKRVAAYRATCAQRK